MSLLAPLVIPSRMHIAWKGLTVMVTGGTSGIGRLLVERLQRDGANVVVHGRSEEKVRALGGTGLVADLASLAEVKRLADEAPQLDVLINNAGVGFGPSKKKGRPLSHDGHLLQLAVNVLAPYVLTTRLLAAKKISRAVVNLASAGQAPVQLDDLMGERHYDGVDAYRQSKLALVMLTIEWAKQYPALAFDSLHPGTFLDTGMVREAGIEPMGPASRGVDSTLFVLEQALSHHVSGVYFDETRPAKPLPQADDAAIRRGLIAALEALASP